MLEGIVRPFQTPQVTLSGQIPIPSVGPVRPASLRWGAVGQLPPYTISWSLNAETYSETSRTTDVVRIYDPNDSTQYVDVQRTKNLVMKHSGGAGQLIYSPFTADQAQVLLDFDAEVQSAFSSFNADSVFNNPANSNSGSNVSFAFNPPNTGS
jgi:hypothetical protein